MMYVCVYIIYIINPFFTPIFFNLEALQENNRLAKAALRGAPRRPPPSPSLPQLPAQLFPAQIWPLQVETGQTHLLPRAASQQFGTGSSCFC